MKIVFMGTPDFAVGTLDALYEAGHEILAAVSQPDKPKGRHAELQPTPVKKRAAELGIPVLQPEKANDPAFLGELRKLAPEVIIVTAYGKLLKKELLEIPPHGCINVHASLLPRWRGAAPIQWAVIEGDPEAGVCTMQMDEGLDTGDILMCARIIPAENETGGSLFDKLSVLGGELIVKTLAALEAGTLTRTPQAESGMTYAKMLTKDMGEIDWTEDAVKIERLIRGLYPWPGTYTHTGGKLLKIHRALLPADMDTNALRAGKVPGSAVVKDGRLFAVCGSGILELTEVQPEGKKRMAASDYLRGYHPEQFGKI